jgi:hypothetical protein
MQPLFGGGGWTTGPVLVLKNPWSLNMAVKTHKNPHHPVHKSPAHGTAHGNGRNPAAGRTTVGTGKTQAAANFGSVSGLTTADIIVLALVAVAGLYLWKKL